MLHQDLQSREWRDSGATAHENGWVFSPLYCTGTARPVSHTTSYSKNWKQGSDDHGGERKIWQSCPESNPGGLCDNFSNRTITPVKIFPAGSFVIPTNLLSLVKTLEGARAWRKRVARSLLADPGGRAVQGVGSAAARLLRWRVRIPLEARTLVSCVCCVAIGLFDQLITRWEESYSEV